MVQNENRSRSENSLALVIHKLATNAARYGALASDKGTVKIRWHCACDTIVIDWSKEGGPTTMTAPGKNGFGAFLRSGNGRSRCYASANSLMRREHAGIEGPRPLDRRSSERSGPSAELRTGPSASTHKTG